MYLKNIQRFNHNKFVFGTYFILIHYLSSFFKFADFLHSLYLQPAKSMIVQIIRNIKRGSKITLHSDHGSWSSSTFILSEVSIVSVTLLDLTVESKNRTYKEILWMLKKLYLIIKSEFNFWLLTIHPVSCIVWVYLQGGWLFLFFKD